MAQLVLYYSLGGKTKDIAEKFAREHGFDVREIVPQKRINKIKAFLLCPKALSGGTVPVNTVNADFSAYETVHVFAPIWAGFPAPPINAVWDWLPRGAEVTLTFVSSSGNSNKMSWLRDDIKIKSINNIKK